MDKLTLLRDNHQLAQYIEQCRYSQFSVVTFDLDSFARVNKTLGYEVGDEYLNLIGKLFLEKEKEFDGLTYRVAGDEFVLILPNKKLSEAEDIANLLVNSVSMLSLPINRSTKDVVTISAAVFNVEPKSIFDYIYLAQEKIANLKDKQRNIVLSFENKR
jgi:diguanylate cyclase (GGDEF)-like protein